MRPEHLAAAGWWLPSAALWLALLAATSGPPVTAAVVGVLAALAIGLRSRRRPQWATAAVLVAVGLGGLALREVAVPAASIEAATRAGPASMSVLLTGDPVARPRGDGLRIPVRWETVDAARIGQPAVLLTTTADGWADLLPGTRVAVTARAVPGDRRPVAALLLVADPPHGVDPPPWWQGAAGEVRAGLRASVAAGPADAAGLLPSLVLGDTSRLPVLLAADLRAAGLSHLTVVSGANVTIVLLGLGLAARAVGLTGRAPAVLAAVGVVGFVVLARPEPSVLRAAVMGLLGLAALVRSGGRAASQLLAVAVLILLLIDPWLARSPGFALSVAATGGLLLAGRSRPRFGGRVLPVLLAAAAAQAAVMPVLLLFTPQVTPAAVLANLLADPAVAPATLSGVAAAVLAPVAPWAAELVAKPGLWAAGWIAFVAHWIADWPRAEIGLAAGIGPALLAAVVLLGVALLLLRAARPARPLLGLTVAGALIAWLPLGSAWPPTGWSVVMCDVGQGDMTVVALPDAAGVVIDTGPDPVAADRCLDRLGIEEVPLLVLTHFHADHVDGLGGVLTGRRIGRVWVSPLAEPADRAVRTAAALSAAGLQSVIPGPGTAWAAAGRQVTVLGPLRRLESGSAANQASLVLRLDGSATALFAGDMEAEAMADLLRRPAPLRADILKVAHHGSADVDPRFVAAVRPRVALIGVGADNDYGHPAPATLAALAAVGAAVGRTDRQGDLAVVGEVLRVQTSEAAGMLSGHERVPPHPDRRGSGSRRPADPRDRGGAAAGRPGTDRAAPGRRRGR
jgi:competence protein ComEC